MNFGEALQALKNGAAASRKGWNGSGLKVKLQTPDEHSKMSLPYLYIEYPHDAKVTPGARCPWVPSITDLMADDWCSEGGSQFHEKPSGSVCVYTGPLPGVVIGDPLPPITHVERMGLELVELSIRIEKLEAFITTRTFADLEGAEQNRMKRQLVAMREYRDVLKERIDAATHKE